MTDKSVSVFGHGKDFSLVKCIKTGYGAHPASYEMSTAGKVTDA
jgi:hypothetical protein